MLSPDSALPTAPLPAAAGPDAACCACGVASIATTLVVADPVVDALAVDVACTERLEELERLQALVVATTAHELRTPLTVLRVHADLLTAAGAGLGPDERASLAAITTAVTRLQEVSDHLVTELRGTAGGAEEALRRWLSLEQGSQRVRPTTA